MLGADKRSDASTGRGRSTGDASGTGDLPVTDSGAELAVRQPAYGDRLRRESAVDDSVAVRVTDCLGDLAHQCELLR